MAKFFTCTALLTVLVAASPQVNYPLNLQFPPIAHVGEQFNFQFASTTFSDSDALQYSLIGSPSWLSLDSKSRTLSGTPRASDVGTASFTIAAAEPAGAVANMPSTLLVSTDDVPIAKENISAALSTAGKLSGPETVTLSPSTPFNISFPPDTFTSTGNKLSYFATLADHTPLPAWINFDASSLHFAGTTPPMESPQSFEMLLIACGTPGFAATSVSFTMMINKHNLIFQPFNQTIDMVKGDEVRITDLEKNLFIDGVQITGNEIQSVTAELPSWLVFNNITFEISGNPPSDVTSQNLTVTAKDGYGDIAEQTIYLVFKSELFVSEIGKLSLTAGEDFEYKIAQSTLAKSDESVTVDLTSLADYLHFDPSTLIISGTVPSDFPPQDVQCSMTAVSGDSTRKDTQTFHIEVEAGHGSGITPSRSSSEQPNGGGHESAGKKYGIIIGSVIGAVCGLLMLVALFLCLRRRKNTIKSYISPKLPRSPRKSDISRPVFIPHWPDIEDTADQDVEKGKDEHESFVERTPEQPPKLNSLDLLTNRRDSHSVADSIGDDDSGAGGEAPSPGEPSVPNLWNCTLRAEDTWTLDTFNKSSYGIQNDIAPSQHPHDSMKIPTELAKRASQKSDTFRKHTRRITAVYQDQIHRSTGLPVNRRITGVGYGRHTYSLSRSNTNFSQSSMRRPASTSSYTTTRCTSIFSTAPSALPQPPAARKHTTMVTTPTEERRSIRIVPASTRNSLADRRTIDERRNSYIRKRASAQSPFFSAGARASSSSYKSPPAFITEAQPSSSVALSPTSRNTIVRPNDDVVAGREKEIPQNLHLVEPLDTLPETPKQEFPGSLRKYRTNRPFTTIPAKRDRVEQSYARPETAVSSGMRGFGRRASIRHNLRAYHLKAGLNDHTGSKVFPDAEMSDSAYSDEERDIEEAEKRTTVKPSQYTLPPLNLDRVDTTRNSKRDSKIKTKTSEYVSRRELKRTSERDPTPHNLASGHEHGGKENASSTYSLGQRSSPIRTEAKGKGKAPSSPERDKPSAARHSRTVTEARKSHRASAHRISKAPSHREPLGERHSRKSIHSRSQSRQSGGDIAVKKPRDSSRPQSSAYPYFDAARPESTGNNRSSIGNAITTAADATRPRTSNTKPSKITRDLSGNLTFHGGDGDESTIEELASSSIGFRTSNGRISSTARQSRLASLHLSSQQQVPQVPPKSAKRGTVVPSCSPIQVAGLGLFPQESPGDGKGRERTPLSVLQGENRVASESKEQQVHGRKTWGSLKSIVGRGGRWVSGGYWDKQGGEDKVFL